MWSPPVRLLAAAAAAFVLVTAGCTGDGAEPKPAAPGTPSATPTQGAPALREQAAPYDIGYRKVAGTLRRDKRARTLRAVSRPLRTWVDHGFAQGPWPRGAFGRAFGPFLGGVADRARRQADLLTLRPTGRSLVQVVPERRRISVSVTSPRNRAVGATAQVDLRFSTVDDRGRRARVVLRGVLYLTRSKAHGWQIFGYDLNRWSDPRGQSEARANTRKGGR